jgi:energy-coupling factor transporter ATP-binding protein EcfA2
LTSSALIFLHRYRYLISSVMAVCLIATTWYFVWKNGFSEEVTERGRSKLRGLSQLWFSDRGDLVGVAKQGSVVSIQPWLGGKPAETMTDIDLEDLRQQAEKYSKLPSPDAQDMPFAVSRDMSSFVTAWRGVVIFRDLTTKATTRTTAVNFASDPNASRTDPNDREFNLRPPDAEIISLAFVGNGHLALLYKDGVLDIRSLQTRKVVSSLSDSEIAPATLFAFNDLLIAVSADQPRVNIYDIDRLGFGAIMKRTLMGGPKAISIDISEEKRIALANGTDEIVYIAPPDALTYNAPGPVSAVSFYSGTQLLAGGEFNGIYLASANAELKQLTTEPARIRLLAGRGSDIAYAATDEYILLSYEGSRRLNNTGISAIVIGGVYLLLIPLFFLYINRASAKFHKTDRAIITSQAPVTKVLPPEKETYDKVVEPRVQPLPRPIPPNELVESCAAGECVLYGGAGLAARAGFPTWQSFLFELLRWSVENNFIERDRADSFRATIEAGRADSVADSIYYELQRRKELPALQAYLRDVFLRDTPMPDVYRILNQLPLAAVLTTNFDNLFERNFEHKGAQVFTPANAEQLKISLSKYEFFILKLYGTLSQQEMVMVAPVQYERAVIGNRTFSDFMETLFFSKTILFVGSSLEGIEAYLQGITLPEFIPRKHYALIAVEGNAWQAQADVLERQYGIKILPFTPTEGFPEVYEFLEDLATRVEANKTVVQEVSREKARITRVILENIGPFDKLELNLNAEWNILLGDNGVGKSTILKAIALAICGKDAQPYAARLIRSGQESGLIILETDRNTVYETRIFNTNGHGEVKSKPARPLEIENWLVVGFPPLRAASWKRPEGPEAEPRTRSTSSTEDVLPLVRGELDPRMDKLKQWIVNLDYWKSKKESEDPGSGARYDKMIQEFFNLVDYLTIDLKLKYKGVDEEYGIRVETRDGQVPIESVSQGTTSLTGWVGILMQRLSEVYRHEDDPKSKYAIVLMDEIDAHMHPAWQQLLVGRLSKKFPNLQFIATTHSPLIVGGMPPEQLLRFARGRDGKVVQIEVDPEMTLGRADQVLTGDLFGLETTIDPVTQGFTTEYQELLTLTPEARSKEQDIRLQKLREILGFRIPETGETAPERRAQELLQALLLEQFGDKFPEVQRQILDRAEKLLAELQKQKEFRR